MNRRRARHGEAQRYFTAHLHDETDQCLLWPFALDALGYGRLGQSGGYVRVHILACITEHGPRPAGMYAAHWCGVPGCFNRRHVRWATPAQNVADRKDHGTYQWGERNPLWKLTDQEVEMIRFWYIPGAITQRDLAKRYGVTPQHVGRIVQGAYR